MGRYLLLHAFPFDSSLWDDVGAVLRETGHQVLAPDLPGFGSAQLPAADPAIDCFVDAILPVLNDEPAVVAGCSMGGYVALGIARRRPELVEALALVDTKATSDAPAAREGRERTAGLAEAGEDWSVGMITGLLGETTRARRPDAVRRVESVLATANAATVAWAQRAMAARPDSRDVVAALDVPILVVMGEEDTMSPRPEQELILAEAKQGRLITIVESGHLSPIEAPAEVAAALLTLSTSR